MTTKEQLQKKIKELQAQVDAMPDEPKPTGNPHVFVPKEGEEYSVATRYNGMFSGIDGYRNTSKGEKPAFRTKEAAEAWADALNVMLELRVQPGACSYEDTEWFIVVDHYGKIREVHNPLTLNSITLSGMYENQESAQAAIKAVGVERIRKAAVTLAGKVV